MLHGARQDIPQSSLLVSVSLLSFLLQYIYPSQKVVSRIPTITSIPPTSESDQLHQRRPAHPFSRIDISDEFSFNHMLEFSKLAVAFAIELGEWTKSEWGCPHVFQLAQFSVGYCTFPGLFRQRIKNVGNIWTSLKHYTIIRPVTILVCHSQTMSSEVSSWVI